MKDYDDYSPEIHYNYQQPAIAAPEVIAPMVTERKPEKKKPAAKTRRKPAAEKKAAAGVPDVASFARRVVKWFHGQTFRWLLGLFLGFFAVYLGVSFLSYFTDCIKDQSVINSMPLGEATGISNKGGEAGARMSEFLINECFGLGSLVIVFWLVAMSLKQLAGRPKFKSVDFTIKSLVALITVSLIIGLVTISLSSPVNWGGYHGRYVNEWIIGFVGWTGAVILCLFMLSTFVVICMRDFINWILRIRHRRKVRREAREEQERLRLQREQELEEMRRYEMADARLAGEAQTPETVETVPAEEPVVAFDDNAFYYSIPELDDEPARKAPADRAGAIVPQNNEETSAPQGAPKAPATDAADDEVANSDAMVVNVNTIEQADNVTRYPDAGCLPGSTPYTFPPVELLRPGQERISVDAEEQYENKERIRKTLLDFGIPITSIEATVGPTVTLYEIVPDKGVKIAKIRGLVDDIALSLSAVGVRIIAPIPGKGTVGIEVANKDPQTVSMRTIIKSKKFQESQYKLPVALGSTISNDVFIADLSKMPHLLVAGATGQGKSVGLNAIIASLLYRRTPDELKFVMIDPKMVEFSLYAKIEKHYLAKLPDEPDPIITDMKKVVATLSSLCVEMDSRYMLLKAANTRKIEEYNSKIIAHKLNPAEGHRFMPYIVVVVDEFSDLIMTCGKEVETPIARLAQKARAVGMHVIIATQRPSTNVITGVIKANFPARIAFKVSSGVDSKTILDTSGAQQLIGRGDMLVSNNSEMVRVQCAFVDTPEVEAICDYIAAQPNGKGAYVLPEPVNEASDESSSSSSDSSWEVDSLFEEVARWVVSSSTASTSSLQRRYSIGFARAGKIMDQLEQRGIVGPAQGGKPRSVLVDPMTLESMLG